MWSGYTKQYPHLIRSGGAYQGRYKVGDSSGVARVLISPTRQWSILIRVLIEKLKAQNSLHLLHGISMNTGGGATKIGNIGNGGILYNKTSMPTVTPEIFRIIQKETGETWCDMYQGFNCGIGIDIVGEDSPVLAGILKEVSDETNVVLYELGTCSKKEGKNKVVLDTSFGRFEDY